MALETATYINDLVGTNPVAADPKSQGDDHIRLVKTAVKQTLNGFPGAILLTATDTGTAAAHVLTPATALVGYTPMLCLLYRPALTSTGAVTVNVSALGAKSVKTLAGADPTAGDIVAGQPVLLMYDGTNFVTLAGSEFLSKTGNQTLTGNLTLAGGATISSGLSVAGVAALQSATGLTLAAGNNTANLSTTAFVTAAVAAEALTRSNADALLAPLASPALTGTPTAPTAAAGTATTQIATTAHVATSYAPLVSPALTGVPTAPTAAAGTSSVQLATTAFVANQAFSAALPGQAGNAGKFVVTDGTAASFTNNLSIALNTARATVASAASADIWAAPGNQINWTGTVTATGFPAAPQAGAERVLITAGAAVFTAGVNMLVDGVASGLNLTCAANDTVTVRAVTTTQFRLTRLRYAGTAGLDANTFTAAQEWATGTAIASAATVNLDSATGNRVHITGTTTITAVTLTRGPRTVIFDGILALTHHATTNNLPGAANITTAAGDRAIYESDGTTVYCVSYVKVSGAAVVSTPSAVSYPQNIQSANYTLVLGDAGKHIFHPASDTAARTFTIPANASVAYPIGTVLVFVNPLGAFPVTVAINTDTIINMRGTTGARLVPANSILTALKITATRWMCYFADDDLATGQFLAVAHMTGTFISAYPWSSAGFGTKFANPSSAVAGVGRGVAFSPAGTEVAIAHDITPFVTAYPWSNAGFGVKFQNPGVLPTGDARGVAFSPAGTEVVVAHTTTPFLTGYMRVGAGFGTKFADPATLPINECKAVAFSPAGTEILFATTSSPLVIAYRWSSAGFGTVFANPATSPASSCFGAAFSPAGTEVAVSVAAAPFVTVYPWSSAGFGVKFADPATLPTGAGNGVAFSTTGTEVAIAHNITPFVTAYPWSSAGFGTKFANPATLPAGAGNGVAFSPAGTEVAIGHTTFPSVTAYPWSSAGFGTKFADPATLIFDGAFGVAFTQL